MLNPQTAKKLFETQEGKVLIEFINETITSLDKVSDIKMDNAEEISIEIKGRKKAIEKLNEILYPLLLVENSDIISGKNKDYVV